MDILKNSVSKVVLLVALAGAIGASGKEEIELLKNGVAKSAIYVSANVMAPNTKPKRPTWQAKEQEKHRRRLRESVKDLAFYLKKISGCEIAIVKHSPNNGDTRLPILIGDVAIEKFGIPKKQGKQGFRIIVSKAGIGLCGKSDLASSYAIYELLEKLGCRWYMPSEMGEVIPRKKNITLPVEDKFITPGTIYRGIWYGDIAFKRRTRQGGLLLKCEHALEIRGYVSKEQLRKHPEWCGLIKGKREQKRFCWTNNELAAAVAKGIIAVLDKKYCPSISLSPNDGIDFCECKKCKALDTGDWDSSMGVVSLTDRYVNFCNKVVKRVTKKYPDVLFGFLAYLQYTRPPLREKLHPNLVPQIAPITYCRAHTMMQADICPSRSMIRKIVKGWSKKAHKLSYYNYMYHLAEVTVPYPMIKQMRDELPIVFANNVVFWQPETLPNFESVLPGMVLAMRISWDTKAKPNEVLDEFYSKFYGAAEVPMRRYWQFFDNAWTNVPKHAGCAFAYPRRFTPQMMKEARSIMNKAIASCKTSKERQRVKMQDDALRHFEIFMKLRRDLFAGRFKNLAVESSKWMQKQIKLGNDYKKQFAFTKVGWTPLTVGGHYFKCFFQSTYQDAARIAKDYRIVSPLLRQWHYKLDKDGKGEKSGWQKTDFDDNNWKTTDPCLDTWYSLGLESYYGAMFYRSKLKIPPVPAGKKVYIWISSTDGTAKVFVNGKHIPYVSRNGKTSAEFRGFCKPASFEITSAIKPNAKNQITIIGKRLTINELGTGGLMGPVAVYYEK